MAIPRNLANLANQLDTSGNPPKVQVGDSSVVVTDTGSNGTIAFTTDNSERMRVTSGGSLVIGTTTNPTTGGFPVPLFFGKQLNNTSAWSGFQLESSADTSVLGLGFDGTSFKFATSYRTTGDYRSIVIAPISSTPCATFNTDQTVKFNTVISVGNATPTTSGAGITFPATQSASSNANTLDDYEEGTFTATLAEGSSSTTYSAQGGFYIKIGRLVFIGLLLDCTSTSASGSIIGIGGLPFTAGQTNNGGYSSINVGLQSGFNTNAGDTYAAYPTLTIIRVYANDGNYRSPSAGGINLNAGIYLSGCYYVD